MASNVALRVLVSAVVYLLLLVGLIVGFVTQVLLWVLLAPLLALNPTFRLWIMGVVFRFCSMFFAFKLNPFWRMEIVHPPPPGYKPGRTLLMVNHLSGADPWALCAAIFPWEFKYVYKASLHKVPLAGWSMWLAGDLPVYFTRDKGGWGTKPGSVASMMDAARRMMDQHNIGMVIFPEGTRSRQGRLQPFKDGFFRFAMDAKCEILPCVLHNTRSIWPLKTWLCDTGTVYFGFGTPIIPEEGEEVEQLKDRVKSQMLDLFKRCPLYDPVAEAPLTEACETRGQGL